MDLSSWLFLFRLLWAPSLVGFSHNWGNTLQLRISISKIFKFTGEVAMCVGMVTLSDTYNRKGAKTLKPMIVMSYSLGTELTAKAQWLTLEGFVFLLLSSFPSPSHGYLIFLMGVVFSCGAFAMVQQRKAAGHKPEPGHTLLARFRHISLTN